jgi:NAD-dependent dihydropyrimidine dehydrogenase PreA subunit
MKRNIITIDHEKCNGCGACVPDCPEGALQIIDGKARLVSDLFCDGLGACIKACPSDAMHIEEREAEPYDEKRVMENIIAQGPNTIKAHLVHLKEHGERQLLSQAVEVLEKIGIPVPSLDQEKHGHVCPGSMIRDMRNRQAPDHGNGSVEAPSELGQWPVQLKLVNPSAPYFDAEEILIAADCTAFAYGNFHAKFLKGKPVVVFCPKLDTDIDRYIDKLAAIFSSHDINRAAIVRMEVPCCGGTTMVTEEAVKKSGKQIIIREHVIGINGEIS